MRPRIVIAQPIDGDIAADLGRLGPVHRHSGPEPMTRADLAEACREAEALMAFMTECIDAEMLDACPRLKIVAGALKGSDNIDVAACSRRGVTVTVVPDLLSEPTAELALGLMIAVARNVLPGDRHVRAGAFRGWRPRHFGGSIQGATVGVVGAGAIGQAVLRLLRGFHCSRLYYDTRALPISDEVALEARRVTLEALAELSDFVVLALPLTAETRGLVDAAFLERMKPDAYLINPARGSLVIESDVARALADDRLAGYAADAFETEDLARRDRPDGVEPGLLASNRTVLTPHLGSAVRTVRRAIAREAADGIIAVLQGASPKGAITMPRISEDAGC